MTILRSISDRSRFWTSGPAASRTQAARSHLAIEPLESRYTPADVFGVVKLGVLKLTAVDAASVEEVSILPKTGGLAGAFTVTGFNGTTIQGDASRDFFGVRSVIIKLKGGDDTAFALNIRLAGGITFQGGDGANQFTLGILPEALIPPIIGGSVLVVNGNNANSTDQVNIGATIGGTVTVANGSGNSMATVAGRVAGGLLATGGPNEDTIVVNGFIAGGVVANLGGGNDSVTVSAAIVGAGLVANLGSGNDTLTVSGTNISAGLVANLGGGTNVLDLSDSRLARSVQLSGGGGPDTVQITDAWIGRRLDVLLGHGSNFFTIDDTADTTISAVGSTIGGALKFTSGRDPDFVRIGSESPVTVIGPVSFLTGDDIAGSGDSLTIDDGFFLNAVLIETGAGTDSVTLETTATAAQVLMEMQRKVTIRTGVGDDEVTFGTDGSAERLVQFAVAPVVQGGAGSSDKLFRGNYAINGVGDARFQAKGFETIELPF